MEKYWAPHVSEGGDTFYGYGWSIATGPGGVKIVTHNGGNGIFFADLAIVPDARMVVFLMTNVIAETRIANSLLGQVGRRFFSGEAYPEIPEIADVDAASLAALAGNYWWPGDPDEGFQLALDGQALTIEAQGQKAFAVLNSVREAEAGRLEKLTSLADQMVSGARRGDFAALFKAYGDRIPMDRLKSRWSEAMAEIEEGNGRVVRYEVLGSARTEERDETVVRFHCEKGLADFTYVWDLKEEGRLLGRSGRGLKVRLRLYPSGERDFFTWDGGVRPPKKVHIEPAEDGKLSLAIAGEKAPAAVR
jgi:hypothetical protein